ncbi:hypothetical protein ACFYKX_11200 [Cytobacillus sp. FJAT-54145]|uniref:Uncharacterized protein n=1 Tax=Cytobacillus spartinae TaxID=3299023 RepID=A0ABW6KAE0_9BACI
MELSFLTSGNTRCVYEHLTTPAREGDIIRLPIQKTDSPTHRLFKNFKVVKSSSSFVILEKTANGNKTLRHDQYITLKEVSWNPLYRFVYLLHQLTERVDVSYRLLEVIPVWNAALLKNVTIWELPELVKKTSMLPEHAEEWALLEEALYAEFYEWEYQDALIQSLHGHLELLPKESTEEDHRVERKALQNWIENLREDTSFASEIEIRLKHIHAGPTVKPLLTRLKETWQNTKDNAEFKLNQLYSNA